LDKKILIFAITFSFIITSIPLAEASVSWNGFLRDIGFGGSQIYEVSAVSLVPAANPGGGNHEGNDVQLRCLDGDWLLIDDVQRPVALSYDSSIVLDAERIISSGSVVDEFDEDNDNIALGHSKPIGWDGRAEQTRGFQAVDIPVIITGLCLSPTNGATIGGEWQSSDTVALFIGYSVLNAYWIAPLAIGAGAGMYLTKSKWKKKVE